MFGFPYNFAALDTHVQSNRNISLHSPLQGLVHNTIDECSFIFLCGVSVQQSTNIWQQFTLDNILESDRYSIYKEGKFIWKTFSKLFLPVILCQTTIEKTENPGFLPDSDPCFPYHMVLLTPCTTAHSGLLVTAVFNSVPVALCSAELTFFSSTFINRVDEQHCSWRKT